MRAVRTGALIGVALIGGAAAAFNVVNCASATTITLEVRGDDIVCSQVNETGIVVTTDEKVEDPTKSPLQEFQKGCSNGKIGTLVITPHSSSTADRNDRVGIRVVAGLNSKDANQCDDPEGTVSADCISTKRNVSFVEGSNVPLTITLSGRCVHVSCSKGYECDPEWTDPDHKCIDRNALNPSTSSSGGADKDNYAPQIDSGPDDDEDAEAGPPTPADLCKRGRTDNARQYFENTCIVTCSLSKDCANADPCPPGQKCNLICNGEGSCNNTHCSGPSCEVDCTGPDGGAHCANLSCDAGACKVKCGTLSTSCNGINVVGKTNTVNCTKTGEGEKTCDNVSCVPGPNSNATCERTCDGPVPNACGPNAACDAGPGNGCEKFEDGGP